MSCGSQRAPSNEAFTTKSNCQNRRRYSAEQTVPSAWVLPRRFSAKYSPLPADRLGPRGVRSSSPAPAACSAAAAPRRLVRSTCLFFITPYRGRKIVAGFDVRQMNACFPPARPTMQFGFCEVSPRERCNNLNGSEGR